MILLINGLLLNIIYFLFLEILFGMVIVIWLFLLIFFWMFKLYIICLFCFFVCGIIWKLLLKKFYKFCFFFELFVILSMLYKLFCFFKFDFLNRFKIWKVSLWKKMMVLICLLLVLVMLLLIIFRWWMMLLRLKNKFSLDRVMSFVFFSLILKFLGIFFIFLIIVELGYLLLSFLNIMMILIFLNGIILKIFWIIDFFI